MEASLPGTRRSLAPAVTRAAAILDAVAASDDRSLGASELARTLGYPKSSVINICGALVEAGLLRRRASGFGLGSKLVELSAAYVGGVNLVEEFHALVSEPRFAVAQTVQLAVLGRGVDVVYLARREGKQPVRLISDPGRPLPANCTATGKVLLAGLDSEALSERLSTSSSLARLTPFSITSRSRLLAELERVRAAGYAVDNQETLVGVVCVAAEISSARLADVPAALSITTLEAGLDEADVRKLGARVQELAGALAARVAA